MHAPSAKQGGPAAPARPPTAPGAWPVDDVGRRVVVTDDAEELQFIGAGRRKPETRFVARPALRTYEGRRRRHQRARARLVFARLAHRRVVDGSVDDIVCRKTCFSYTACTRCFVPRDEPAAPLPFGVTSLDQNQPRPARRQSRVLGVVDGATVRRGRSGPRFPAKRGRRASSLLCPGAGKWATRPVLRGLRATRPLGRLSRFPFFAGLMRPAAPVA